MATVEDVLAAFPEDTEAEPSPHIKRLLKGTRPYPSPEESESCLLAIKAAMEVIGESCAEEGFPVNIAGTNIRVPPAVLMISRIKLGIPREDHIEAIRESAWFTNLAYSLCKGLRGFTPDTPEYEKCAAAIEEKVIEQLVK